MTIRSASRPEPATRVTYTPSIHAYGVTLGGDSPTRNLGMCLHFARPSAQDVRKRGVAQNTPSQNRGTVSTSEIGDFSAYLLDAQKYVNDARHELRQAMDDGEQSPILAAKLDELARAEGELQAFTDWGEFFERYGADQVLVRLTEASSDPVLLHPVRRPGYLRAVSHIFRGTR